MTAFDPKDWYWVVAGDEARAWSNTARDYVDIAQADPERVTRIGSFDSLVQVLRAANVPPYHKVSTYRILRRLEDAGRIDAAEAALNANRVLWRRFYTVGAINADDADSRAFLAAIGADADAILAPE